MGNQNQVPSISYLDICQDGQMLKTLISSEDSSVSRFLPIAVSTAKEISVKREEQKRISVQPSCFVPEFEMIISVPNGRDSAGYIDELLDAILNDEFRYNVEWDFVDGSERKSVIQMGDAGTL